MSLWRQIRDSATKYDRNHRTCINVNVRYVRRNENRNWADYIASRIPYKTFRIDRVHINLTQSPQLQSAPVTLLDPSTMPNNHLHVILLDPNTLLIVFIQT